ncbi:class 1b ribonucleoside-diphosphate reductase subunit alpha [Oceanivirga miroungae]|uniref:Ribonucleoside-diphosphate reductase n=1 Tax=Oceanivirga miroungae TaxID=1130046 RepID=A0A6I8MA98_9FUSO|nr:class 1b ribonucleoside-diphosphate reductase subunit alpha [Oceanivirga miroungae]VWL85238.1 ribonucleoside-diphosphate reductase subunit alpha [Oceanivirga miroungae]
MEENSKISKELEMQSKYLALNATSKLLVCGKTDYTADKKAAIEYMNVHVIPNTKVFNSVKERIDYLVENNYYEKELIEKFKIEEIEKLHEIAYSYNHKFPTLMGAMKFYNSYCLTSFDKKTYLEDYEQRVVANAILLSNGDFTFAKNLVHLLMKKVFQPATPTFLNALKKNRGEYVSCYLLRTEDNMESIARSISTSLQLSKRGGGVSVCLTNLREYGSSIKGIKNVATGVIPVMKLLEDTFSYANQLGQRQGAGAVYLNVHHPDILRFLDTKRENADEKIRIKSLSLGVVIPDITFLLAKENKEMALFSPQDIEKEYNLAMSDISITEEYDNLIKNDKIKKTYINARKLFQTIAELHFESGYPYILFDDTVNRNNAHPNGRIVMSNLCSEIAQVNTKSTYEEDLSFLEIGQDVSCNLGSINISEMMLDGENFGENIYNSIKALDFVSRNANLKSAKSIENGNNKNHALGLGAMNLHGFLATNKIFYDSPEALDFTNIYFYIQTYYAFLASNKLAIENKKSFENFSISRFANGEYFDKYTKCEENLYTAKTKKVKEIFEKYKVKIPTQKMWIELSKNIVKYGLANSHLQAVAPTGSISYLSSCTPSLQPVVSPVEVRKEGKLGRIYVPAYKLDDDNLVYYEKGAYELGPNPIIDIVAEAQKHVDQAISLTLFMTDTATTRDLNKAYIRAFSKKCASIYYVRIRQDVLKGSESLECQACMI